MHYEIVKRPPIQHGIPAFATGAIIAFAVEKALRLSFQDILILYKAAYSLCFPIMLAGAFVYQHANKFVERGGLLLMYLAMVIFGMLCFYFFTSILIR